MAGEDRHSILQGTTFRLSNSISQNLVKYLIKDHDLWSSWESLTKEEDFQAWYKKQRFKCSYDCVDECDTTFLTAVIEEFLDNDFSHDQALQRLRALRNSAAHQVTQSISPEEYSAGISKLVAQVDFFKDKYQKITEFESLKKTLEEKLLQADLPADNFQDILEIVGRHKDLQELESFLEESPLVLITGAPGIGKSSLALTFAKTRINDVMSSSLFISTKGLLERTNEDSVSLKNKISRSIGLCIGDICEVVRTCDDSFAILLNRVQRVPKNAKLWIILDNIDDIDRKIFRTALEDVICGLCLPTGNIKFICTSRSWTLDPKSISKKVLDLKPISLECAVSWLLKNTQNKDESLLKEVAKASNGVPLIMKLYSSRLTSKNRKPFEVGEIPKFRESRDYHDEMDSVLGWSFEALNQESGLILVMQCTSLFPKYINESALKSMFNFLGKLETYEGWMIERCADLSLIEYNFNIQKYHLHPYIQEYVLKTYSEACEKLKYTFFVVYYSRLMQNAQDQLRKDNFDTAVQQLFDDIENYQKFLKLKFDVSNKELEISAEHFSEEALSEYWLLASFWYLEKIKQTKIYILDFAKFLENIFLRVKLYSHVIICKCFISHQVRLMDKYASQASEILEEASTLSSNLSVSIFCLSYLQYSKGRLVRQMVRDPGFKWEQKFEWENVAHVNFCDAALKLLNQWRSDVTSQTKSCVQLEKIERIVKIEEIEILSSRLIDDLDKAMQEKNEPQLHEVIKNGQQNVNDLENILGKHGETTYSFKKLADILRCTENEKDKAASLYERLALFRPPLYNKKKSKKSQV